MKKTLLLLLISISSFAQISLNPLQKYMKRVEYVFDTIQVDETHQILVICGDSVLINLPDTARLNTDWGTYQQAGYGYETEDFQYNLDIRFNGSGNLFFSDSIHLKIDSVFFRAKKFIPTNANRNLRMDSGYRCWIRYVPHTNKFWIYRREQL